MTWPHAGLYGPESFTYPSGASAVSAEWTLRTLEDEIATVYVDRDRSTEAANPGVSDTRGNVSIYADPGVYRLTTRIHGTDSVFEITVNPDPDDLSQVGGAESVTLKPDKSEPEWNGDGSFGGDVAASPAFTIFAGCKQPIGTLHDDIRAVITAPGMFVRWGHMFEFTGTLLGGLLGTFTPTINGVSLGPIDAPSTDDDWRALRQTVIDAAAVAMGGTSFEGNPDLGALVPGGIVFVEQTYDEDLGQPTGRIDFHTTFKIVPTITIEDNVIGGTIAESGDQYRAAPQVIVVGVDETNAIDPDTFAGLTGIICQRTLDPTTFGEPLIDSTTAIPPGTAFAWLAFQGLGGVPLLGLSSPEGAGGNFQQLRCVLTQR